MTPEGSPPRGLMVLPVVHDLHRAILLDPQLPDDDVVDTAGRVGPGVGLVVSVGGRETSGSEPAKQTLCG